MACSRWTRRGGALLLLVLLPALALAQEPCAYEVLGASGLFGGAPRAGSSIVDHSVLAANNGRISRVGLYFSKPAGCLRAIKAAFGSAPPTPGIIGSTTDATERALKLEGDEHIVKAEYKADQCIEFLRLHTSKGRVVAAGKAPADATQLQVSAPPQGQPGQLLAIKGLQAQGKGNKPGPLQQLELVWGGLACEAGAGSAGAGGGAAALTPESAAIDPERAEPGSHPGACKPRPEMCSETASMNAFTYCVWNPPYSAGRCRGGCCVSSGKCASSSCAISGMGRDVPNMICYGVNRGASFGGSAACAGLACKLAVPGCTTDAFGGNCVGSVVPFGTLAEVHPSAVGLIGAACLDATPSDDTLDVSGAVAASGTAEGIYMGKLWSICDCSDGASGAGGLPEPAARLLNLTTTRISNFTKNEVLAAFSTLLPQRNTTEELEDENARAKAPASLLPSIADMFKFPSLSSISLGIPSLLGYNASGGGGAAAAANGSLPLPKLPDVKGLLQAMRPAGDAGSEQLKPEGASVPKGSEKEFSAAADGGQQGASKPSGNTLGGFLAGLMKSAAPAPAPAAGDSDAAAAGGDGSAPASKPQYNLADLLGKLRKAGPASPPASTSATLQAVPAEAQADAPAAAGGKKPDLSAIGALLSKFVRGPAAAPAAAPATAAGATTQQAAAKPAAAAQPAPVQATTQQQQQQQQQQAAAAALKPKPAQPTPAPAPAPAPAPVPAPVPSPPAPRAPAVLMNAPSVVRINTAPQAPKEDEAPMPVLPSDGHKPGDPSARPPTLAQRLREKKIADAKAKAAGGSAAAPAATPAAAGGTPAAAPAPAEEPAAPVIRKRNGFSAMHSAAGQAAADFHSHFGARPLLPSVTAGVLGASQLPSPGQAAQQPQGFDALKQGGGFGSLRHEAAPAQPAPEPPPELAMLAGLVAQLKGVQAAGGALPAGLDLDAVDAVLRQLSAGQGSSADVAALLNRVAAAVTAAASGAAAPGAATQVATAAVKPGQAPAAATPAPKAAPAAATRAHKPAAAAAKPQPAPQATAKQAAAAKQV